MTLFGKVGLTQPLQDRRDYGSSDSDDLTDKQFELHLKCMKYLGNMAEKLSGVADSIEDDDFPGVLDNATELKNTVTDFVTSLKSNPVLKLGEYDIEEMPPTERAPSTEDVPTEKYEKEGPPTLRSQYSFWLNFPGLI